MQRFVVKKVGGLQVSPNGYINMNETTVRNVEYPSNDGDATNKLYVDRFNHVGDIKMSVYNGDFYGWLKCDGRSLSRTTYADLFAVISTSFGSADGDSFNLPDCRGRVLGGLGQGSGLTNRTLGNTVGAETHTLTTAEMPSHNHEITDPGHTHTYVNQVGDQNTDNAFSTETAADQFDYSQTTGSSTTGITVNNAGGGNAHNNMQPTLFISHVYIYSGVE